MSHSMKVKPNDSQRGYILGVKAGAGALEQLKEIRVTRDTKLKYFWLTVGTELAQAFPHGGEAEVSAFVAGASARQPTGQELDPRMGTCPGCERSLRKDLLEGGESDGYCTPCSVRMA